MKNCRSESTSGQLLFLRAFAEQSRLLTNKNVMQGTILKNDSINNGGDLSCTHRNLHFKAIHTKRREACCSSNSNFHKAPQPSVTQTEAPWAALTGIFDGTAAAALTVLQHPTQKSLHGALKEEASTCWGAGAVQSGGHRLQPAPFQFTLKC